MKCKCCGAEIVRIKTMGGTVACWAEQFVYWPVRDNTARELLTKNGMKVYGNLTGDVQDSVGIAYLPHTCNQRPLLYKGMDSWSRPVYEYDGTLYVDTDPRKGREPRISTKYRNAFDGEPCDPVKGDFDFIPERITWD